MDVMELRRRLMMGMAKGADVIKGTFTIPSDFSGNYTISFGKDFNRYFYIVEMTPESKMALMQTGENNNKAFARAGIYPTPAIQALSSNNTTHISSRVNPSTEAVMSTVATMNGITNSTIVIAAGDVTGASANVLYKGFSYNYIIVSLDNV